jgi:hypothetical protein
MMTVMMALTPLEDVAAARDRAREVDAQLRDSVERARAAGRTWAEIGVVLGTTRQAAFQRFGRPLDPRTGVAMAQSLITDAGERAIALFAGMARGRWRELTGDFDARMTEALDADRLAAAWAQVVGTVGGYERMGEPVSHQAGDYTVVDVPLFFEAGDWVGKVSYDRDGKVAGLFIRPGDAS